MQFIIQVSDPAQEATSTLYQKENTVTSVVSFLEKKIHVDSTSVYMQNTGEKYQSHSNKERKLDKLQICQARILYPEIIFFSLKVKKTFLDRQKLKKFITCRPALPETLLR